MLATGEKLAIIGACCIFLCSVITCREVSILGIDYNGISTVRRSIGAGDSINEENSDLIERGCNELRLGNFEGETTDHGKRTEIIEEDKKSFAANKKAKTRKKNSRSGKKLEERILRKANEDRLDSLVSDNLEKRSVRSVNSTDYFAQRKAVMDRYFARRREIAAKYAKGQNNVVSSRNLSKKYWQRNDTLNVQVDFDNKNRTLEANNEVDDSVTKTLNSRIRENSVRDVTDYFLSTSRNCSNATLSGSFPQKSYNKLTLPGNENREIENELFIEENRGESTSPRSNRYDTNDDNVDRRWGSCDGTLVYQHNLLLNLRGPSNLDALFDVVMEGPICITCVEILRYNHTRALVSLDSGGRGHGYAKLRLKGYENEGFSYIVKVWGVKKTADDCSHQL